MRTTAARGTRSSSSSRSRTSRSRPSSACPRGCRSRRRRGGRVGSTTRRNLRRRRTRRPWRCPRPRRSRPFAARRRRRPGRRAQEAPRRRSPPLLRAGSRHDGSHELSTPDYRSAFGRQPDRCPRALSALLRSRSRKSSARERPVPARGLLSALQTIRHACSVAAKPWLCRGVARAAWHASSKGKGAHGGNRPFPPC